MKKLIIIDQVQFGYLTDNFQHCKFLKDKFRITFICWHQNMPEIKMSGINIKYICRRGAMVNRSARFLKQVLAEIDREECIVFIKYFKWMALITRLLRPKSRFIFDIRTGSVHPVGFVRWYQDWQMKFESLFFKNITIISESLAAKLKMTSRSFILPLGAEVISETPKSFERMNLLYVGTLFNRNIEKTITGFKMFFDEYKNVIPLSYTIIGNGPGNEVNNLKKQVERCNIKEHVNIVGRVPYTQLKTWFHAANIGVSFVPVTDYYHYQPVTKTYEFLLSGMPVIATSTYENMQIISPENGILIDDSSESFYDGLKRFWACRNSFDSRKIKKDTEEYTWEYIASKKLIPYLNNLK